MESGSTWLNPGSIPGGKQKSLRVAGCCSTLNFSGLLTSDLWNLFGTGTQHSGDVHFALDSLCCLYLKLVLVGPGSLGSVGLHGSAAAFCGRLPHISPAPSAPHEEAHVVCWAISGEFLHAGPIADPPNRNTGLGPHNTDLQCARPQNPGPEATNRGFLGQWEPGDREATQEYHPGHRVSTLEISRAKQLSFDSLHNIGCGTVLFLHGKASLYVSVYVHIYVFYPALCVTTPPRTPPTHLPTDANSCSVHSCPKPGSGADDATPPHSLGPNLEHTRRDLIRVRLTDARLTRTPLIPSRLQQN